jgi:hypothetical protein
LTEAVAALDALTKGEGFHARRNADGIALEFCVLRAPGVALGLTAFALLCGLMPALGLSALLPLESANASALVSLALIGGFAAPFILASIVFLILAVYLMANSLHVEVNAECIRTVRRVFGRITKTSTIAHADIADIEPRISARYQNMFSATPRYALVAKHHNDRQKDVVVAEDLRGQPLMSELRRLICTAAGIKINE